VTEFRKIVKYQISLNSVQWEPSCSMWTDGRTDMTKSTVDFCNFANAPKNYCCMNVNFRFGKIKLTLEQARRPRRGVDV